ncbi:hypothetical protein [Arenimonas sp.]|uniref:hypothetical protein n=1 Tax=Arenimonas sp. TaxID=1872635 RepID=UPI0039E4F64F
MLHRTLLILIASVALFGCQREAPAPASSETTAPPPAPAAAATTEPVAATPAEPTIETLARADDTLTSLQERLGAANAIAQTLPGAEGEEFSGWVLYPDDPTRKVEVYLDESGEHPDALVVRSTATHWVLANGLRVGMDTKALQELNGKPFKFYGFEWDYGGTIVNWDGGKLDPGKGPHGGATLCLPEEVPADYPTGDAEYSSDDPRLAAAPAVLCEFGVRVAAP